MRYLRWLLRIVLFLLLLGLAIKNTDPVALRYFLGWEWKAPLSLVLFLFFLAGVALGLFAGFGWVYRLRRELAQIKREVRSRQGVPEAAEAASEPPPL